MKPRERATSGSGRRLALLVQRYGVALGGTAWAFTLGLRSSRHRALIAQLAEHFGFAGTITGKLPLVGYDEATSPSTPVTLPVVLGRPGNITEAELIALSRTAAARQPRTVLEIGTFDGRTTLALAANTREDATVVTVDLPPGDMTELPIEAREVAFIDKPESGAVFSRSPYARRIRQVYGDSATCDFGVRDVELAFIDGSHSYEYALSDSRRVRALMNEGRGVILWHDYGMEWEGVTRALDELAGEPGFRGLRHIEGTTLAILDLTGR
jgi:hypothetical protein